MEKTQEQIQQEIAELEAKKIAALKEIEDTEKAAREKKVALEAEHKKILDDINEARNIKNNRTDEDNKLVDRLKNEYFQSALSKVTNQYEYKQEDIDKLTKEFTRFDDGSVTESNIIKNLTKAHLSLNSDKYLSLETQVKLGKVNGDAYNTSMSSMGGVGNMPAQIQDIELDALDLEALRWNNMPVDTYKRLKAEGKI